MRILIIGASGFIGTHLVSAAATRGIEVLALTRSGAGPKGAARAFAWSFGKSVPEDACKDVVCAIHLAHDFNGEEGARCTLDSTVAIASQLQNAGVQKQLFFSSYSAGDHATSLYGKTKFSLEQALAAVPGIVIVRPGLVLGEGGIYGRIRKWARVLPFVPLPGGGWGKVPVIDIEKLCALTINLAMGADSAAEANLFERELKSLRQLVLEAAAEAGRRPWILPIPAALMIGILTLAARLHIPLPVNADNLAGFLSNQSARHASTLEG